MQALSIYAQQVGNETKSCRGAMIVVNTVRLDMLQEKCSRAVAFCEMKNRSLRDENDDEGNFHVSNDTTSPAKMEKYHWFLRYLTDL
jgi:hypothetical protein